MSPENTPKLPFKHLSAEKFLGRENVVSSTRNGFFNIHHALKAHAMRTGFTTQVVWEPAEARVLPYSEADAKVGKRVSQHPLHDTFISPESKQSRKDFYDKSGTGALVADIDAPQDKRKSDELISDDEVLPRVQRVFTMPLADLLSLWKATAHRFDTQRRAKE